MSGESGNPYPVGYPRFWEGEKPEICERDDIYYFIRIKCRFYIKDGYLPFIQIKNNYHFQGNVCLTTSDTWDADLGMYVKETIDNDGNIVDGRIELTLTKTDWILFNEHYDIEELEVMDGCYFGTEIGIFDEYIEKYKRIKETTTGAKREESKLFLNNLYGKLASSDNSSFKVAYMDEEGFIKFHLQKENNKSCGYIAIGSAITSYARNFTIRAAQKNYHGPDKPGFIYADTDSIHCDLPPEKIVGIKVHDTHFLNWKLESCWDIGYFVRQKTYIERVIKDNLKPIEPYYNIKCAGLPENCKSLFLQSLTGVIDEKKVNKLDKEEREFLFNKDGTVKRRKLEDFAVGIMIPGKLRPERIKGGVLLKKTTYKMH